jgi:hypothetical protein
MDYNNLNCYAGILPANHGRLLLVAGHCPPLSKQYNETTLKRYLALWFSSALPFRSPPVGG